MAGTRTNLEETCSEIDFIMFLEVIVVDAFLACLLLNFMHEDMFFG